MSAISFALFETAIGCCGIVWEARGVVGVQLPERDLAATRARLRRRYESAHETVPPPAVENAVDGIVALLRGEAHDFSDVVLVTDDIPEFDRRVYAAARTITAGATLTYGELAQRLGDVALARAVGRALGRNPFPIIVPCHRVLAAGGKAGGFSAPGGVAGKLRLLNIERARTSATPTLFDDAADRYLPSSRRPRGGSARCGDSGCQGRSGHPYKRRGCVHRDGEEGRAMNWISNVVRPKIRNYFARRETPENLWIKCPETGQLVFYKDVEANQFVIPGSDYHMRMSATARLKSIFDNETWFDIAIPEVPLDPLKFRDERRYTDRLKDARTKTGTNDAIKLGFGKLDGLPMVIGVQDFDFMGGSLGMAAGEAVIKGLETAVEKGTPFIMFAASGGARMQEGILSLMQMPRTTVAVQMLREASKPYIVVLTNPTTGGVTASYAMLGDVHIAEPGALIGFAGPRVIEQTIREKLPDGFQRAEYLKEHGMVDMVVHRRELRPTLANLCRLLTRAPAAAAVEDAAGHRRRIAARLPRRASAHMRHRATPAEPAESTRASLRDSL